jgi:dihydrofolate synthase / folylpolyglutamate synthase
MAPTIQRRRPLRAELDGHPARHGLAAGRRHWVLGMLANKQAAEILTALLGPEDRAWIVPVPDHASWRAAELAAACPALAGQLQPAGDLAAGLAAAGAGASGRVIVAGSLYLIGNLLAQG